MKRIWEGNVKKTEKELQDEKNSETICILWKLRNQNFSSKVSIDTVDWNQSTPSHSLWWSRSKLRVFSKNLRLETSWPWVYFLRGQKYFHWHQCDLVICIEPDYDLVLITISIIMMSPRYKQGEFFQNDYVYTLTQTQFYYVLTQQ